MAMLHLAQIIASTLHFMNSGEGDSMFDLIQHTLWISTKLHQGQMQQRVKSFPSQSSLKGLDCCEGE